LVILNTLTMFCFQIGWVCHFKPFMVA